MSTREQRVEAFRTAQAIAALEGMVEPEGFAQLRQDVIDGKLSFGEAVSQITAEVKACHGAGRLGEKPPGDSVAA